MFPSSFLQAIKFAVISDESNNSWSELSHCYAERSACYFSAKDYTAAVSDVDLALAGVLPHDQKALLYRRKLLSLKYLGRDAEAEHALSLMEPAIQADDINDHTHDDAVKQDLPQSLKDILKRVVKEASTEGQKRDRLMQQIQDDRVIKKENPELANANPKLRLNEGVGRGRFIAAAEPLAKDEVLIHESAAVSWLRPSCYQDYCFHCLKEFRNHFLIPCSSCALVSYCSTDCRNHSWNDYHCLECRDLPILRHLSKAHMVSRILLMQRRHAIICPDLEEEELERNKRISLTQGIVKLISHSNDYSLRTSLETCLGASFFAFLMQALGIIHDGRDTVQEAASSLVTYLFQLNVNCLQVVQQDIILLENRNRKEECWRRGDETRTADGICYRIQERSQNPGYGLYLTSSFLNHSCFNTTKSFFDGNALTFVSSCDIAAGQEITFNYGPHYKVSSRQERRKYLKDLYFFACDCKACHEDWT